METAANTTTKLFDATIALAAMTLGMAIKYRWEKVVIWHLVFGRGLNKTRSYVFSGGEALKPWQRKRVESWGIHTHIVRYDDNIPQSMSDAPCVENRYVGNETAEALAAYLGLTADKRPDLDW